MLTKLVLSGALIAIICIQEQSWTVFAKEKKKSERTWTPPWFNVTLPDKIRVIEGQMAELVCSVCKLRGRAVSWIRQRDLHVISANTLTFTSDDRFQVVADVNSSTPIWILKIDPALRTDSGIYECQVNTRPKLFWPVELDVEVPSATLEGPSERYIQRGSTLVLTCNSTLHPDAITTVIWHHNGTAVNITSQRGGLSIQTDREGRYVVSRLSVVRATPDDAGIYKCAPDLVHPANATVFVVEGEHRAATHHNGMSSLDVPHVYLVSLVLVCQFCIKEVFPVHSRYFIFFTLIASFLCLSILSLVSFQKNASVHNYIFTYYYSR